MHTDLNIPNEFISGIAIRVEEGEDDIEVLIFDDDEPKIFKANQVVDIEREYKVISINDNVNKISNESHVLVELSRIDKTYSQFEGKW